MLPSQTSGYVKEINPPCLDSKRRCYSVSRSLPTLHPSPSESLKPSPEMKPAITLH